MELKLLQTIEMPNYPRSVVISKSRRAKYFIFPKDEAVKQKPKYNSNRYQWRDYINSKRKIEVRLFDTATEEFVIKNNRVAGKEKRLVINGQRYYNGTYQDHEKGKILNELTAFFTSFLKGLRPIFEYPIHIEYIFETHLDDDTDVDNHGFPYYKGFQDCLFKSGLIINDTHKYVKSFMVKHIQHNEININNLIVNIYAYQS